MFLVVDTIRAVDLGYLNGPHIFFNGRVKIYRWLKISLKSYYYSKKKKKKNLAHIHITAKDQHHSSQVEKS